MGANSGLLYSFNFLFSAFMFFLDVGFMKLPCSFRSQMRHCVLHFSLAGVYYAHLGWKRQQQYNVGRQLLYILDHKQQGRSPAFRQLIKHEGIFPNHPAPLSPLWLLASNFWQAIPSPLLQLNAMSKRRVTAQLYHPTPLRRVGAQSKYSP